jgi:hypothetical protein
VGQIVLCGGRSGPYMAVRVVEVGYLGLCKR